MKALKISIIGKSNGVGLARDLELLSNSLRSGGHDVVVRVIDAAGAKQRRSLIAQCAVRAALGWSSMLGRARHTGADINLMIEHVWWQFLPDARLNVAVPNPEWFDRHDMRFLSLLDCVWAKTAYTDGIFRALGCKTSHIGFDSEDRHLPAVPRQRTFFHLAGKSTMKGTDRLLRAWAAHSHWPRLIVVQHHGGDHAPDVVADNIERRIGYLDDQELKILQNTSMFHICLSRTEGWGHYIVEALSVGALTLTVDAPPMNELVTPQRGVLVGCQGTATQGLATTHSFDEGAFESAVEHTLAMSDDEWIRLSSSAREWFLANRSGFRARLDTALRRLSLDLCPVKNH